MKGENESESEINLIEINISKLERLNLYNDIYWQAYNHSSTQFYKMFRTFCLRRYERNLSRKD